MRDRKKLRNNEERNPNTTLRRSPRFLHGKQAAVENPETPKPAEGKTRPNSFSTPLGFSIKNAGGVFKSSTNWVCLDSPELCVPEKRVTRSSTRGTRPLITSESNNCGEISKKGNRKVAESKRVDKSSKGLTRSAGLNSGANVMEKRVTRSCTRGSRVALKCKDESSKGPSKSARLNSRANGMEKQATRSSRRLYNDISTKKDSSERVKALPEKVKGNKVGFDLCEQTIGTVEKRVTRSTSRVRPTQSVEVGVSDERQPKGDAELYTGKGNVKKVRVGQKRKRSHVEGDCDIIKGWTEEQELVLRRAYFTAKPTPQFWKKVAKMVPGKSAEDCFNRIHSDHLTPSQTRTRSRPNKKQPPSPLPYSASKLLHPAGVNTKKPRARRKTLQAQKTVRHLLEKQCKEDQNYKADLFSILEPSTEILLPSLDFQETTPFASPVPNRGGSSALFTRTLEMSSSGHAKQFSRLNTAFVSPPVLKQIKNKALHERYIDQLHCRDAKRKAHALRNAKSMQENDSQPIPVRVAKDALFFDAQNAIDKLRKMKPSADSEVDVEDDDDVRSCDDEDGLC